MKLCDLLAIVGWPSVGLTLRMRQLITRSVMSTLVVGLVLAWAEPLQAVPTPLAYYPLDQVDGTGSFTTPDISGGNHFAELA